MFTIYLKVVIYIYHANELIKLPVSCEIQKQFLVNVKYLQV